MRDPEGGVGSTIVADGSELGVKVEMRPRCGS